MEVTNCRRPNMLCLAANQQGNTPERISRNALAFGFLVVTDHLSWTKKRNRNLTLCG
jgi:hypothetical protein